MGTNLNRDAYEKLIDEDLEWLLRRTRSLERDHIEAVLRSSPDALYGPRNFEDQPVDAPLVREAHAASAEGRKLDVRIVEAERRVLRGRTK